MEPEQARIKDLLKENPKGLTIEEVSKKLSVNRATAAKYLTTLTLSGQAELRELGRAKMYYLSQRLPLPNLLSLSSDLILILDRDLFIQEANEAFLGYFGIKKEDLKGKKIEHSPIAPFFPDTTLAAIGKALDGTETSSDIHFDAMADKRYFRMKLIPLVFEDGSQAAGIILEDISEMKRYQFELENRIRERTADLLRTNDALQREVEDHKRAEEALRQSEAVLRSMLNATPIGVGLIVDRVFKTVNDSLCLITGYSQQELTGKSTRVLYVDSDEYARVDRELYGRMGGQGVGMLESRFLRRDGTVIDVLLSISPFDPENLSRGVTVTVLDITERKKAAEALKRASTQVALLTSIIRHDILNQLTALRGYLGHMKKLDPGREIVDLIGKEEAIAETIRSRIIFTRDYQNVGIHPPDWIGVADTIAAIRTSLPLGPVTLSVEAENLQIYADPLIGKVFSNLIENSLQHGARVTEIRISSSEEGDNLLLVYEDNGVGIPENEKETIFSREYGSTRGYGMFLIREILAITGLSIRENGIPGKGARFAITVPKGSHRLLSIGR